MSHTKCDNCNKEFPNDVYDNHKLYCIFSLQDSELQNLIPCELCNQLINFETYHQHLVFCNQPTFPIELFGLPHIVNDNANNNVNDVNNVNNNNDNVNNDNNNNNDNINNDNVIDPIESSMPLSTIENIISNADILLQNINMITDNYDNYDNYENLLNLDNNNQSLGIQDIDKFIKKIDNEIECPICTEKTIESCETICKHYFCYECMEEWLKDNKKCPVCMKEFLE